jgi:hypothetical protein
MYELRSWMQVESTPTTTQPTLAGKGCKMGQASILMVSHCGLAIYYIKKYLKAKEELWKLKYFTMQKYNLQTNPYKKKPKSFKILYNSITNLKFQHKPKYHLSKILISKWTYYLGAKIP